jgi:hypothetical protein
MNFSTRFLALCAAAVVMAVPALALPPVPISHPAPGHRLQFDPKKFMRVEDLKPGMRGYALTVFHGTKIERFGVEILGVIKKYNEGKDYILFRATSGPPVTDHLNIAHGMSGSPIYIHGKLVGAISMELSNGTEGPSFPRDPIGLATPIESMFDAWSSDLPTKPSDMSAGPPTPGTGNSAMPDFSPIAMPVSVSGVTPDGIARLGAALAPYHFTLSAGGGGGGTVAKNLMVAAKALQPGAAVGVSLMQGDMDFTATGTVTYRDGDRVLLFGHPFFDLGPIDAAMTTASVVGIYPSYQDSVKLGQPLQTVGRIFQDRPFSVGGLIGSLPHMIPMIVTVNDLAIHRQKTFHVQIINHPLLTGQFVPMVEQQAIEQVHGLPGDTMATVSLDADVDEIGHVRRTNTFYDAVNIDQAASADLTELVQTLQSNPFYPLAFKSIRMNVTLRSGHDTAVIDHMFLGQQTFHPGEIVPIGVVLKPYKRAQVREYLHIKIPNDTSEGPLTLSVAGGTDGAGGSINLGGLILITSPTPTDPTASPAQLLKQFQTRPANNTLVATLTLPTSAIVINGQKLINLPPTLAGVIQSTRSTGIQTVRDQVKVVQPMPYVISGSQSLTITVKKNDGADLTPAPNLGRVKVGAWHAMPVQNAMPVTTLAAMYVRPVGLPMDTMPLIVPSQPSLPPAQAPAQAPVQAPPPAPDEKATVKAVGRLPTIWRQDSGTEFVSGTLKNVSVSSRGDVRLSAALQKVADTPETYVWAIQPDGHGSVYLGTGDRGIIYKMPHDGVPSIFFKTGQLEVTCLALGDNGDVFAGTAPHGVVYEITPSGKGHEFFKAPENYITALATTPSMIYIATGGGTGKVYSSPQRGSNDHTPWVFTSSEAHILSLATDKNGNVYAGSSPDGIVYKITPDGEHSVLYAASEPNITSLTTDSKGNVDAGTSPDGHVYQIAPDGAEKTLLNSAHGGVMSLRTDTEDNLYACTSNTISRIALEGTVQTFTSNDDAQFITLGISANDQIYAGTSTVGSVYRLGEAAGPLQGQYISSVHNTGLPARWGALSWIADTPPGTYVTLQTRSGDVPDPDTSWSDWSPVESGTHQAPITSPTGRYLQYKATLSRDAGAAPDAAPRLESVTAYYLMRNRPPTVTLQSPVGGAALHKNASVQWAGSDPDGDTLSYDLSYSTNDGKTWTLIQKPTGSTPPATASHPLPAPTPLPVTDQEVQAKTQEAIAAFDKKYPNLPPSVRQTLLSQAAAAIRAALIAQRTAPTTAPAGASGNDVKATSFAWDTTKVPDGNYRLKIVASDKPSNPAGWLTDDDVSQPFLVANTPPTLTLGSVTVNADKTVTVHGVAQAKLAIIQAVQGHADGDEDIAALADDGLFDTPLEAFTLTLGPLMSGSHMITVTGLDQASNTATATVSVQVP